MTTAGILQLAPVHYDHRWNSAVSTCTLDVVGQLNEYGILKAEREKKLEGGAGKDQPGADFDEYTIYNEIKE